LLRIVERLDDQFTLRDVLLHRDSLSRAFPANKHVDAKIRQQLQILRDRKVISFEGGGRYRRLVPLRIPSLHYELIGTEAFRSTSQIARVALETWSVLNFRCRICASVLIALPPNTPISDLACSRCASEYQIKSRAGPFSQYLLGASYEKLAERLQSASLPDYLLVEHDPRLLMVKYAVIIEGAKIDLSRLRARKPLAATARRAGWVGANIDISNLETIPVVIPSFA
jgi:hypothetical protein